MDARNWVASIGSGPGPRRRVAWLGGAFIAAIVGLAIYDSVRDYREASVTTGRELQAQARVIAEQTARSVQAVDVVLRHLVEQFDMGRLPALSPDDLHRYLKEKAVGLVQTEGLVVFDADGNVRALSWVPPAQMRTVNVGAEEPFQRLRDGRERGLMIANAVRSPSSGRWLFPIARPLRSASGAFVGVVSAPGRIEYFQRFYGDAHPEPTTRVSLLHRDGHLLARHPPIEGKLGTRVANLEQLLPAPGQEPVPRRTRSPLDGVDHFVVVRPVHEYPLVVAVSRDAQAAFAPWRAQTTRSALRTLALATLAALLLAVVLRQLARLDAARRSLEVSQERYALAAAGSDDGIWDWDLQANSAYESVRARELQGLPLQPETQPLDELKALLTYHPDDAETRRAAMQAHLDGRTPAYEVEYRVRRDGEYRWIHVRALCIRDASGRPLRIAGSVSDVDAAKRAEVALRQSEERFAVAVAGSDDGIWLWDFIAGTAFASRRARELNGTPEAPELQPIADWHALMERVLHPDDVARRRAAIEAHLAGATPTYEAEYRVRAADGGYRWLRVRGMCMRDADGRPLRIAGSVSDIDSRKRAEEGLRASEERFVLAVAGANDGILDWDIVADRWFASERAMRLFGLEPDDVVRTQAQWAALIMPRFHPDDVPRLKDELRGTADDPADTHEGEYRVRGADGEYHWMRFRGRSVRDAEGRAIRWAGAVSDVDAQKRAEQALRRSEERYQLAVDGSNEGLWDWDLANDMLFLSPRAQQLTFAEQGEPLRPREEWIARTVYHPDDVAPLRRAIRDHLRGTTPHFSIEYRLQHHSGTWHWYRQRGIALRDASGRAYRMAGSMEDITPRKQAEVERERLEQQLRQAQKLEAIGTLAGGIAHDFNNILSAILGYGELVQKDAPAGSATRRHIDATMAAGLRAKSLVERILAFSRGRSASERVPVHVPSVLDEALDSVAGSLPAGIVLERRASGADAGVLGDPTQIHQVVMNLCTNAVQAMKSSGTLSVSVDVVRLDAALAVATRSLPAGRYVALVVRDTGSGIAPEVIERIFDPFFTTKQVGVGTGLGLSLVHGIVSELGGGIAVDSRPGDGTAFTVYLPWHAVAAAPAEDDGDESIARGDGQTILFIDDEEALVHLGEEMLAELGYEPVGFASPADALAEFHADPDRFDAVLTDEAMPGTTGTELAAALRHLRPALPVVLMSGFVNAAISARAHEAGVADVLAKPLRSRDIARSLAAVLRASEPLAATAR